MSKTVSFIGAGNLATQLSKALKSKGYKILQVYSRTEKSAKELAKLLGTEYTNSAEKISSDADLYFVALKDSVVTEVLSRINFKNKPLVHCSGSLPLSVLGKHSRNIGVLYPLQTFSKERAICFDKIPIFIEANSKEMEDILLQIGETISGKVTILCSDKRKTLHVSAVFACNFVNHMYSIAASLLENRSISFDVLKPLIEETAEKVQNMLPKAAQTGPAIRFDENIVSKHLEELEPFPQYQELYNSISKSIFDHHQEKNK